MTKCEQSVTDLTSVNKSAIMNGSLNNFVTF